MSGIPEYVVGQKVYVRELDVFGEIIVWTFCPTHGLHYYVACEYPLPEHVWDGPANKIQPVVAQ